MRRSIIAAAIISLAALAALAVARPLKARAGSGSSAWNKLGTLLIGKHFDDKFNLIHVNDLAALRANPNSRVVVFDANGDGTREKYGVIPGARLLSSYNDYNVATELPSAKKSKLVFYCANTR